MSCRGSDSECELEYAMRLEDMLINIGHCPPSSNNCSEDDWIRDVQSDDDLEMASCSSSVDDTVLISIDSLKHGFFETESTGVIRVTHRCIHIEDIILEPDAIEIRFTSSDTNDKLLTRYGEVGGTTFAWRIHLAGLIETDSLQICAEGREFVMRKQEVGYWGRLSSSATAIRPCNYSTQYGCGPNLSSYRYSASLYTPSSRLITPSTLCSEQNRAPSATSITPTRSPSILPGYQRLPYSASAVTRSSTFSPATFSTAVPALSSGGRSYISPISPSPSNFVSPASTSKLPPATVDATSIHTRVANTPPPSAIRSRSSSAIASYRSVNVAQLNQQARERAERDEKVREYKEWEERERLRIAMEETPLSDIQQKCNAQDSSIPTFSSAYSQFCKSTAFKSELVPSRSDLPTHSFGGPSVSGDVQRHCSYTGYKPTATVQPFEERVIAAVPFGFTGLRNIGNTCFMNATLQMLINNIELKIYFLDRHYKLDINPSNPLGFKSYFGLRLQYLNLQGRLADAFGDFMRLVWNRQNRAIEPTKIKELVAEKASQFANFAQHDAHEFLSFLLDGLHEDLNRVKSKPLTTTVQGDGRSDVDVSTIYIWWNDSIFVDLFHGQLKSRLQCPKCYRVSITFDPFVYLPVPFPKLKKMSTVWFWPHDPSLKPLKLNVHYSPEGSVQDFLNALSEIVKVPSKVLRLIEVFGHRIQKVYSASDKASDICSGDVLYAFQMHDPADCNEPVIELFVVQRQLYSSSLRYACNECGSSTGRLKACEACYNAYYCNKECQMLDWNEDGHRDECRRRTAVDHVGQPFMVSLPRSQLTYHQLIRVLESRCRFSVDIFQPPQLSLSNDESRIANRDDSEVSNNEEKGEVKMDENCSVYNGDEPTEKSMSIFLQDSSARCTIDSTPRRQSVLPEQRKKPEFKMFLVRKLLDQTHVLGDIIVDDKTGQPLDLINETYISINWYNLRNGRPFISVENKRVLQVDEERSEQLMKKMRKSTSGLIGDPTLQDMLEMFSETEQLKPEESWYCNKCREHVEATKKLELFRLPPILIIQLKRFVYTATYQALHRRSKDERRVIYPISNLDMSPFLAETAPTGQNTVYDLTGVVCHSGSSYFGHYVSIGRLPGFDSTKTIVDWRLFDDSIVSKQSVSNVQSDDAYLLFYKQRGLPTRSIFRKHYSCDPTEDDSNMNNKVEEDTELIDSESVE
ncbi:MYND finger [Dictyocaulus viviparus]|uniref:ubiquitinyl hydrolase 1 n=1 Tax=Dictyocaulus viviparus TaxID=29172 RepID=A0A0D8XUY3_DICVI|nr:MYND finger [Dictyocaulus viviparus]